MHIAMYAPALPSTGSANGIVTYTRIMQRALSELGCKVTVFDHHGIEHSDGSVERVPSPGRLTRFLGRAADRLRNRGEAGKPVGFAHVLAAIAAKSPIDIFEMEESFGWVGRISLDVPVVARLHGPHFLGKDEIEPPDEARTSVARIAAEGVGIGRADGATCPSADLMAETLRHYDLQPRHCRWIPNPMPLAAANERWTFEECDPRQLLFVGRFDLRKGADVMLDAFALLAAEDATLNLTMCGPDIGIADHTGERLNFEQYAAARLDPAIRARIQFLGAVPPAEIARLRRASVLCVSTSRFEVLAYSLAEALAVGMPVVASDTFGMREILRDGVDGMICPVGDAQAVADAIRDLLTHPARLKAIAEAGRAVCETLLSPARIAEQTLQFYRSL